MPVGEEVILKTGNVRVRIVELGPNEVASLHSHNEVTDNMFCLSGRMSVRMQNPDEETYLLPGQRCTVSQGRGWAAMISTSGHNAKAGVAGSRELPAQRSLLIFP